MEIVRMTRVKNVMKTVASVMKKIERVWKRGTRLEHVQVFIILCIGGGWRWDFSDYNTLVLVTRNCS